MLYYSIIIEENVVFEEVLTFTFSKRVGCNAELVQANGIVYKLGQEGRRTTSLLDLN